MVPFAFFFRSTTYQTLRVVTYPCVGVVLGLLFLFAANVFQSGLPDGVSSSELLVFYMKPAGMLSALPIFVCGMNNLVFTVFEFPEFSPKERLQAVRTALGTASVIYWTVGVLGFAAYGADTAGDVLRNMDGVFLGNGNARIVKAIFGLSMLLTVPCYTTPLQEGIADSFVKRVVAKGYMRKIISPNLAAQLSLTQNISKSFSKANLEDIRLSLISLVLLMLALVLSVFLPNLEFTIGLTGATTGIMTAFLLPCFVFVKQDSFRHHDAQVMILVLQWNVSSSSNRTPSGITMLR
jgi:sodium-coupled neutral amino acid transporter 10